MAIHQRIGKAMLVAAAVLLLSGCAWFQPSSPPAVYQEPPEKDYKKPWKNQREKKRVMVLIAARLLETAPVKDACIEKVLKRLHRPAGTHASVPAESRDARCEKVMSKCGACHLPRANVCAYRVSWHDGKRDRQVTGNVDKLDGRHLHMLRTSMLVFDEKLPERESEATVVLKDGTHVRGRIIDGSESHIVLRTPWGVREFALTDLKEPPFVKPRVFYRQGGAYVGLPRVIPIKKIKKIEWLNGGAGMETWWDFKRFSPRGRKARRMFDIAVRHRVGCTNCHVGHGDFRLTREGRIFQDSGKVIRRVPLEDFLRGR